MALPGMERPTGSLRHRSRAKREGPMADGEVKATPLGQPKQLAAAERCGARTRSGHPCRQAKVKGRPRCRMHGGAKGSGAPPGVRNGRYRDGHYTKEAI